MITFTANPRQFFVAVNVNISICNPASNLNPIRMASHQLAVIWKHCESEKQSEKQEEGLTVIIGLQWDANPFHGQHKVFYIIMFNFLLYI